MGAGPAKGCCSTQGDSHEVSGTEASGPVLLTPAELSGRDSEPLTDAEIGLVENTWKKAAGLGAENVGAILFKHIFTIAPDALNLFSFKKEPNVKSYDTPGLRAHGLRVVTTVGTAVDSLRNLSAVVPVLQELAIKHVGYNVAPEHYDVVGKALMMTLRDGLGPAFTEPVQIAWAKVWKTVSSTMIEASMPHYQDKKKKDGEEVLIRSQVRKKTDQAKRVDAGPLTRQEIHEVQESWSKVMANGEETVAVTLFRHIFMIAPDALQLFPFKDEWKNLYDSPKMKTHAVGVVGVVNKAVDGLTHLDTLVPILKELGTKHVGYSIKKPHYDVVGQALVATLQDFLVELFTDSCKTAWLKVWGIVATTMQGSHYD